MTRSFVAGLAVVCAVGLVLGNGWRTAPVPAIASVDTKVGSDDLDASSREGGWERVGNAAPASGPAPLSREQRMARVIRAVWPDRLEDVAIAVAGCETGGTFNPRAFNPEVHYDARGRAYVGSWGLFQVAAIHTWAYERHPRELWNPWRNARAALGVFRRQGWAAWWHCSRKVGAR